MAYSDEQPRMTIPEEDFDTLLHRHRFATLATLKRDGTPHLASVLYTWHPEERTARISTVEGRVLPRHLRRDPRVALHVHRDDHLAYGVIEGVAELSSVTTVPGDATGRELLSMGAPPPPAFAEEDEAGFLRRMVAERRMVIRIRMTRRYGVALP